ncbi:MAG: hypothetical protein RLW61_18370 [Gammaproteobacteria bacterium]
MHCSVLCPRVAKILATTVALALALHAAVALAGNASAEASAGFSLYLVDGIAAGTDNRAVVEIYGASGYGADSAVTDGTGMLSAQQEETVIGDGDVLFGVAVGAGAFPYTAPGTSPTLTQTYTVSATATAPAGSAAGRYSFAAIIDVYNPNAFAVELEFALHAALSGRATRGEDAGAASSVAVSAMAPGFAVNGPALSADETRGCAHVAASAGYCESATPPSHRITLPAFATLAIDVSGDFAADALASEEVRATRREVPLPLGALAALAGTLAITGMRRACA